MNFVVVFRQVHGLAIRVYPSEEVGRAVLADTLFLSLIVLYAVKDESSFSRYRESLVCSLLFMFLSTRLRRQKTISIKDLYANLTIV